MMTKEEVIELLQNVEFDEDGNSTNLEMFDIDRWITDKRKYQQILSYISVHDFKYRAKPKGKYVRKSGYVLHR